MADIPVTVHVNLTGVSYSNGVWSGTPSWNFTPGTAKAFNGDNTINWSLQAANPPGGYTSAFPNSGAIVFKQSNNPQWPGGTPTTQSGTSVTATDNFQNQTTKNNFHYTTSVVVTAPDGVTTNTYSHDPDIQNDPGGVISHDIMAEAEYV